MSKKKTSAVESPDPFGVRELAAAVNNLADAWRYQTKVRAGLIHQKAPEEPEMTPEDAAFEGWLGRQDVAEAQREEIAVFRDMVLGRRPATGEQLERARRGMVEFRVPMPVVI